MSGKMTGYPSIDKPWLKYYSKEAVSAQLPDGTAFDYLYENNKGRNKVALEYFGNKITFSQLFENISTVERAFYHFGIKAGDIVAVSLPNTPEAVYIFYALSKIGAVANMIDPRTSVEGIKEYIEETKSSMIIMVDVAIQKVAALKEQLSFVKTIIAVSPSVSLPQPIKFLFKLKNKVTLPAGIIDWKAFYDTGKTKEFQSGNKIAKDRDKPVLIVHTGGTTGLPKGVVLSNLNINAIAFQSIMFPNDISPEQRWLDIMPPFISYGIGTGLHFPLCVGMCVILIPAFDPEKFDELILKHKPSHISGVPSHWYTIINSKKMQKQDLSYLFTPGVGGDSMDEKLERDANQFLKDHNCKYCITKGYGMSETNGSVCRTLNDNNPIGSVGVSFSHTVIAVFDPDTQEELKYNEMGELCMSGPSVMLGYYNKPEETAQIKRFHHGREWIHSGDIGYMNEDGNIFIFNRIKRMIIRFDGFKVFPSMIEKAILTQKEVVTCCVVGVSDKNHNQGKLPIAYVVTNHQTDDATVKKQLLEICKRDLPDYAQLKDIVIVDNLPLTPIGKVDYRALEKLAEENNKG